MSNIPHSTQDHLPIAGIQDGVVMMNDGSLRLILKAEPINFDLKSAQEQDGIIYSYQSFLNSLEFPIQIVIQSKKLDLEQYLVRTLENTKKTESELMRLQIEQYTGFVRQLISVANIMAKRFYVVISHAAVTKNSSIDQITNLIPHHPTSSLLDQAEFDRLRNEIYNKGNVVASSLARIGVKSRAMETQETIELFYGIYNPDVAGEERLTEISNLESNVVRSPETTAPIQQEQPQEQAQEQPQ